MSLPVLLLLQACAASSAASVPVATAPAPVGADAVAVRPLNPPIIPPAQAFRLGWMPRAATGADAFVRDHPQRDGRGVLVAILDSGIDAGAPGLQMTSAGSPKLLDLRDFSGEGRVALAPVVARGDTVLVSGRRLAGAARVRGLAVGGAWYGGVLAELPLGDPEAADVNANGRATDSLPLLVVRTAAGWAVLADTDDDGSVADERPVHDYLVARDHFGWAPRGERPRLVLAANVADSAGRPLLDLLFDTSGHGTHVAGIAAGHAMYGVPGFDGVAPGAQLLGLKIADDAQGGVSVTGSMLRGLAYAVDFARARGLPLVVNLSFGVGNEVEGTARIDALIDSVLAAHPQVVMTVSAGNDGPGLSTLGFPASAARVIAVGATYPAAFLEGGAPRAAPDMLADFSARGGEVAGPQLLAPGIAYSTVPRWKQGGEREGGTSMASPHVAGLAALLLSAATAEGWSPDARSLRHAMMVTAMPLPDATSVEQGTGVADVRRAWTWLRRRRSAPLLEARVAAPPGLSGAVLLAEQGRLPDRVTFRLRAVAPGSTPGSLRFRSSAAWLVPPTNGRLEGDSLAVGLAIRPRALSRPGVYGATVTAWSDDSTLGPVARMPVTVVVPYEGAIQLRDMRLAAGAALRLPFRAAAGRSIEVAVSGPSSAGAIAYLHEPGGRPYRGGHASTIGEGDDAATFDVEAPDVEPGVYELVVQASQAAPAAVRIAVRQSPVSIAIESRADSLVAHLRNEGAAPVEGALVVVGLGAERRDEVEGRGGQRRRLLLPVPSWARSLTIELRLARETWGRFTDFGASLFDGQGRQLATAPLNYAIGQLEFDVPGDTVPTEVTLGLFPGLADPGADDTWRAMVTTRYFSGDPADEGTESPTGVVVPGGGSARVVLARPPGGPGLIPPLLPLLLVGFSTEQGTWLQRATIGGDGTP